MPTCLGIATSFANRRRFHRTPAGQVSRSSWHPTARRAEPWRSALGRRSRPSAGRCTDGLSSCISRRFSYPSRSRSPWCAPPPGIACPPPPSNASGAPHPRHPRPQPTFAFALASSSPAARLTPAGPAFPAESSQLQYDVALDTGILSFRARDEPYAINYDAVLAAIQWSRGHTRFRVGPPAPPAPADRPPPAPTIERLQSHASYWLTVVYETHPPGGNVLTPERLDAVRRVEAAVLAVEGYENFCRLDVPAESFAAHPEACARWVPPETRVVDHPSACPDMRCSDPISLVSFEARVREWFRNLTAAAAEAATPELAAAAIRASLERLGFPDNQATSMAATLAEHPSAASAFADMPLVDLLALVPPGALTRDVFGVGHEPGWFFDKWYATGVDANADASDTSKIPSRRSHGGSNATGGASREPAPAPHAVALRSGFEFALPLTGYATADDRRDAQEAAYRAFARRFTQLFAPDGAVCADARAAGLRVLHAGGGISEDEAAALVLGDLAFATVAFALVFACMVAYSRSLWFSTHAVLGVALAFPSAFFFWRVASASPFVSFLNALVPFVLIGIGCDDALVVRDAFEAAKSEDATDRSRPRLPSEEAFAATFASAAKAMFATSLTTAVAFGSNAFSYIPPVRALGAFAALTVCANYALVLTLLPASMVLRGKGATRVARDVGLWCLATSRRGEDARGEDARGAARGNAARGNATGNKGTVGAKRHGKTAYARLDDADGGEVEMRDMSGVSSSRDDATSRFGAEEGGVGRRAFRAATSTWSDRIASFDASARAASIAAVDALGDVIVGRRRAILVVALVATSASAARVAAGVRLADVPPPLLREDTNLQRVQHLLFDVFYTESWSNVKVAFGIGGVDRSRADPNDPASFGDVAWDPGFDFSRREVQLGVLAACDAVLDARASLAFTPSAGNRECALQAFARDQGGRDAVEWGAEVPARLAEWARRDGRAWRKNLGWEGEEGVGRLAFLTADYYVNLHPVASTTEDIRTAHDAWEAAMVAANDAVRRVVELERRDGDGETPTEADDARAAEAPDSSSTRRKLPAPVVFQACDVWNRMGVEESVRYTAAVSPPVSASAAAIITYAATGSWRVTLATVVTIGAAVVAMLAALVTAGWRFGVVEELCATLLIGSSVDYCIHLAVAYAERGEDDDVAGSNPADAGLENGDAVMRRNARARAALRAVAGTITGAAATTAASSAMLLACRVEVLVKIGATIVANTAVGYVLSLFLFTALMATFGD